mmetsp:Transcript_22878/g.35814  ORF Transcript_22878/g.35814 Transcript_22878/m.35814 type:complete len:116 (+) Transcript_22878:59-406(+)
MVKMKRPEELPTAAAIQAHQLSISADLLWTAKVELAFLDAVDQIPGVYTEEMGTRILQRYEHCWLPLVHENKDKTLAPPIDVEWAWHCHTLCPVQYVADCKEIFGKCEMRCRLQN